MLVMRAVLLFVVQNDGYFRQTRPMDVLLNPNLNGHGVNRTLVLRRCFMCRLQSGIVLEDGVVKVIG